MTPDGLPDPVAVAVHFTAILEDLGIRHLVGGSLASSIHGEPRSTNDIDILADFREEHVSPFIEAVEADYHVSTSAIREAIRVEGSFNAIHTSGAMKVDVFIAGSDRFNEERLARRERLQVGEEPASRVFMDTAEHSVLRKLEWYRRGGETSDRQWRDVVSILRIQDARLDRARLDTWADRLGVSDLLERASAEARSR